MLTVLLEGTVPRRVSNLAITAASIPGQIRSRRQLMSDQREYERRVAADIAAGWHESISLPGDAFRQHKERLEALGFTFRPRRCTPEGVAHIQSCNLNKYTCCITVRAILPEGWTQVFYEEDPRHSTLFDHKGNEFADCFIKRARYDPFASFTLRQYFSNFRVES